MQSHFQAEGQIFPPQGTLADERHALGKPPRLVLNNIFAFPPNRDTLGGTAYLIVKNTGNLLIDCPAWNETNQQFLTEQGGVSYLFLSHRAAIGKVGEIQSAFGCKILMQEQEAYLLPGLDVITFQYESIFFEGCSAIWTPGYSPGSSCLYSRLDGGVIFSGRHLLPSQQGNPAPLRTSKTFHWFRQLQSVQLLLERFSKDSLSYICPGGNTGFLRGKGVIDGAYERLSQLDLAALRSTQPLF
ncbi:MAG: MBL fold metallo-hydrolase [Coleofasciculaceae cyanobacterium]